MNPGTKVTPSPADSKFLTAGFTRGRSLFQWDSWEVRLLHPEAKQAELFVGHNLAPLRIGESIFAAAAATALPVELLPQVNVSSHEKPTVTRSISLGSRATNPQ